MDNLPSFEDTQPVAATPEASAPQAAALPSFEETQPVNADQYSTPGQQLLTGVEGAAKGVLGPIATGAELGIHKLGLDEPLGIDLSAEAQNAREEANPTIHGLSEAGGLGASLLTGFGEAGLIAKGAEHLIPEGASIAGKIGSSVLKGAIENGLIQGGNEISDAMLGKGDPEAPVAAALSHMGAAALLGGAIGGTFGGAAQGLKAIADSKAGSQAAQWVTDLGAQWNSRLQNPDVTGTVYKELKDLYQSTNAVDVYGNKGFKLDTIEKLLPTETTDAIVQHAVDTNDLGKAVSDNLVESGKKSLLRDFSKTMDGYNQAVADAKNPIEYYKAANDLKKELSTYIPWKQIKSGEFVKGMPRYEFVQDLLGMSKKLQLSLEDSGTWGEAGGIQKDMNALFTKAKPASDAFKKTFTKEVQTGMRDVDPGTVKTYVNTAGKSGSDISDEIRPKKMKNYIDSTENLRNGANDIAAKYGVEAPFGPTNLNTIKSTYGVKTAGSKAADTLFDLGVRGFSNKLAHSTVGGAIGYQEGGIKGAVGGAFAGAIAPHIEDLLVKKLTRSAVPAALSILGSGKVKGIAQAMDYVGAADSGAQKITKSLDYLFKSGVSPVVDSFSESHREKLRKYVENGELNNQLQSQLTASQPAPIPTQGPTQAFAEGGEVKPQFNYAQPAAAPVTRGTDAISEHFPTQNILLNTAKGRINNYLNSQRPQAPMGKLPFDNTNKDKQKERSYDKVLDLANQPLSIVNHIKSGTLTPEQMGHFTAMYPELYNQLNKKMTERITKMQMSGEKPPYKVRQAMSLFLKAPLDSSMTPASAMAVQGVFAQKKAQQQSAPQGNTKKGTSNLNKVSQSYQTGDQSRLERQQKV